MIFLSDEREEAMFRKSLIVAAAMAAGAVCSSQAEARVPTKFVQFTVSCASGTTCSKDIPLPTGTRSTYSLKGISCTWVAENVTRVDIEIVKKSNRVQQFIIPAILSEEERLLRAWISIGFVGQSFVLDASLAMMVNFRSSQDGQMVATCYAAF
jgi:hypothetical protein